MPKQRVDPGSPQAPVVGAVVTMATRARIEEMAAERKVTMSRVTRELIERGLIDLSSEDDDE